MDGFAGHILAVILAAVMAAAPGFCPCVGSVHCEHQVAANGRLADSKKQAAHGCCGQKAKSSTEQAPADKGHSDQQPCKSCKMTAKADRSAAKPDVSQVLQLTLAPAVSPPLVLLPLVGHPTALLPAADTPPLLRDLFHTSCLLTV